MTNTLERHIRGNLSGEPNRFIGRERELTELLELARVARALTLYGPGGIGKTRLAIRVLTALAGNYPDGAWFVEFADLRQPELVESRIASVIGVTEEPGRPLIETLADALRPRRILLALDSCEHLVDACARICQRLLASSPGLRIVATSREPLRVAAETVWQVPPLWLPAVGAAADELLRSDAIRLFTDRAAAARSGYVLDPADQPASLVAGVCRVLDGLPLAIELAAAWVRVLTVEQIAARLDDRFRLLRSGERAAPARQRTLRATIDWSHDLLGPPEQMLLRRLSVLAGWSLEMAEQICAADDLPAGRILDLLTGLTDKSLVIAEPDAPGETRYRMLDTIRSYAAARLADAGESGMMQGRLRDYAVAEVERLARIGMALIEAPWSARLDTFRRFDLEADNLRQALSYCRDTGDVTSGLRICAAARPVWIVRGNFAEGAEWFDTFLSMDAALDSPDVPDVVRGAGVIGRAQLALAFDPDDALERAKAGLDLCRLAGAEFWIASALNLLAEIALHAGRLDEAAAYADEAMEVARSAGDRWNEGYALGTRGAAAGLMGDLAEAERLAGAGVAVMRGIDQQWGVARTLLGLGDLARLTGDGELAHRHYQEALAILREVNAVPEIARCLAGLGRISMEKGDTVLARRQFAESIELSHSTGSRIGVIRGLEVFADLAGAQGQLDRAVQLTSAGAALRAAAHLPPASGSRMQRVLDAAAGLGASAIIGLQAAGSALTMDAAVAFALEGSLPAAAPAAGRPGRQEPVSQAGPRPDRLTARERQIAALTAAGRSNKAIAGELFITEATAARHIANIMSKLGCNSRAEIAQWVRSVRSGRPPEG